MRAFMAHHQGMTIVAIANVLLDGAMRARFHAEPIVQATELLLQERTPRDVAVAHPRAEEVTTARRISELQLPAVRRLTLRTRRHAADASAVQRPLCGDADGRGLRLQPLGRSRDHALARGRDPRRLGQLRLSARRAERRACGRPAISRAASSRTATRSPLPRTARSSSAATARSPRRSTSSCRRRTTPKSAASRSPTRATVRATSRSRPTPSSCWRRPPPTRRIRRSRSSSCRPNISPRAAPSWRRGAAARPASRRSGRRISPSSKARPWASRRSRPIAPASSAAGARPGRRSR